ncbi:MAG TPA: hypothetical protein VFS54_08780 [Solirubrobacterales bacterium]|nr:hypothetical protein [Solirubrobacterales bacterium]
MSNPELFLILVLHFVLTALPGVAAALLAARLGVRSVPVLLATGMVATGVAAMLAFWLYFADPLIGESFSYLAIIGPAALTGWLLYERRLPGDLLRQLAMPLGLWALGSLFLVFFGFIHGGSELPLGTAATRFIGPLPSDNDIPSFFANWYFQHGHESPVPIFPGEWLSSDRPPLQVGYVLAQRPIAWDHWGDNYQVLGVILQQLWIVGLWALLLAARVGKLTRALVMITVLVSDVALLNGFFVWPKMLPAAMLLAAAALVMTPLWEELRKSLWAAALIAALCGLAMMGHGSSIFGIVPLALIAVWRGLPSWRWVGVAVLVGLFLFQAPWSAYQKYHDPPGNRLVKYMLAGVPEIDDRGTLETIADSYDEAGVGGTLHNKGQNFVTMFGGEPMVDTFEIARDRFDEGNWEEGLEAIRTVLFFDLFPSLGLLLLAPLAMIAAHRRRRERAEEWNFALICFAILAVGAIAWGLLLFGNAAGRTVMHAGSFALPIFGFCACVAGLRASFPRFATWYVAISAALMLAIYTPATKPLPGTAYSATAIVLAILGLAGFVALSLKDSRLHQASSNSV